MEIGLVALAGIGLLLFLYSFLAYIIAGFKHHPVTGLISMLPVLNIVTLPSLWHLTGRKLIIGFIGLLIAIGSWVMGAEQGFNNLVSKVQGKPIEITSITSTEQATQAQLLSESNMQGLPGKALYRMAFEPVKPTLLVTLQGKTIQIVTKNHKQFEGRLLKIINTKVILESVKNSEIKIALDQIDQLSVMVKQSK
jgi:hypothetical protein